MKCGKEGSVKAGSFGFSSFGRLKENGEVRGFVFLVGGDASLKNGNRNKGKDWINNTVWTLWRWKVKLDGFGSGRGEVVNPGKV